MKKKNIILGITGSIAAYKACDLISQLKKNNFNVECILTKEGANFITAMTLETLSSNKVHTDMFAIPDDRSPQHISLADKADLIIIAPATANVLGKIACGITDDLLTCTVCSSEAPVLLAPAMNNRMYLNKIVQKNIGMLEKIGYKFVGPIKGQLACGSFAIGHIAQTSSILSASKKLLK